MLDWENLRYFLALAQTGSLGAAARELGVNHATVGRRVAALELALNAQLLERLPRRITLTTAGRHIFDLIKQMDAGAYAVERAGRAEHAELQGKVVISAPPVLAAHFLAPFGAQFRKRLPGIELSLSSETRSVSLSRREADIVVRLVRPTEPRNVNRRLGTMSFGLYAARSYRYLQQSALWEFICYDSPYDDFPHQKEIIKRAGARVLVFRVSDMTSMRAAALAGAGVALLPRFIADRQIDLVEIDRETDVFSFEIWGAVHYELRHSPVIKAVFDWLTEMIGADPSLNMSEATSLISQKDHDELG